MITIVGLGPGSVDDLSLKAWRRIKDAKTLYLRTTKHPCVKQFPEYLIYTSFDDLYDSIANLNDIHNMMVEQIIQDAKSSNDVVYAVPGDPLIGEGSVVQLLKTADETGIPVEIVHGISPIEPILAELGLHSDDGIQILDALTVSSDYHPPINPEIPAVVVQLHHPSIALRLKSTLLNQYPADFAVKLIHGVDDNEEIHLDKIDSSIRIGAMTSLYLPPLGKLTSFESFQNIIAHLRSPEGCPWDRKQTHQSLRPYLIEEAFEVLETIDNDDTDALYEELGDLLLQIVLHTQVAIDKDEFYMSDILRHVNEKMIRRHPHVWGEVDVQGDPKQVTANWEDIKKAEKANSTETRESILDGVPKGAPALFVAHKYQHKVAKVGFDWADISGVEAKFKEELEEVFSAETDEERAKEIGDMIFVLVNWLRWLNVDDPESLLRDINAKFYRRFTYVEQQAGQNGRTLTDYSLEEMDKWWNEAKSKGL